MEVIPAVDLMKGKVVRLTRGDPETLKAYESFGDPVAVAKRWEREGADAIHIIDLDAALDRGSNLGVVMQIARAVDVPVQVGGGIRDLESARNLLATEVDRVIVGALAFENPAALRKLLEAFGRERVVVALDHRGGVVVIRGWRTATKLGVEEAMGRFLSVGAGLFLVTSVTRDGTLQGPDYDMLAKACGYPGAEVLAAGGIGCLEDLVALKRIGVRGVVIGKALYEGAFKLREAIEVARER